MFISYCFPIHFLKKKNCSGVNSEILFRSSCHTTKNHVTIRKKSGCFSFFQILIGTFWATWTATGYPGMSSVIGYANDTKKRRTVLSELACKQFHFLVAVTQNFAPTVMMKN